MSERALIMAVIVVTVLVGGYWAFRASNEADASSEPGASIDPNIPQRTVAFDNLYGSAATVPVFVTVDDGLEQALTATCDAKACTFKVRLTNARHELTVSVIHDGRRSAPARVTVDTSNMR
jgi:hypothetical protein